MSSSTLVLSLRRYARRAAHTTPFPVFLLVLLALLWFQLFSAWRIAVHVPDQLWPSDSPEQHLWRTFPPSAFVPREKRDLFMPVDLLPDACLESCEFVGRVRTSLQDKPSPEPCSSMRHLPRLPPGIGQGNPCTSAELGPKESLPTLELDVSTNDPRRNVIVLRRSARYESC